MRFIIIIVGAGHGKCHEHRLCELYRPAMSNNAPMDFIFGVDKL